MCVVPGQIQFGYMLLILVLDDLFKLLGHRYQFMETLLDNLLEYNPWHEFKRFKVDSGVQTLGLELWARLLVLKHLVAKLV